VPGGDAGQVGVLDQLPAFEAQQLAVAHRDRQQRAVRQPAEARRLPLDLHDHLALAVLADGQDLMRVEVRHPPAA
jgi:hypothetical protein